MTVPHPSSPSPEFLARCRRDAHALRRLLRSPDSEVARAAAQRLLALPGPPGPGPEDLLSDPGRVRLDQALAVVALEQGFGSWSALRSACEATLLGPTAMYTPAMSAYLNLWFADHDEARASRLAEGGYLLPYRDHFFVTNADAIRELGLDPDDPDWERIGWDWVAPRDREAHGRLVRKRKQALAE